MKKLPFLSLFQIRTPSDVYSQLLGCFTEIKSISELYAIKIADIKLDKIKIGNQSPSDVFDLASILDSELSHLGTRYEKIGVHEESVFSREKNSSDVFQRVRFLKEQLKILHKSVKLEVK